MNASLFCELKLIFEFLYIVLKHKWYVFVFGLRLGAPFWRLVIHDWTKFLPSEIISNYQTFLFYKHGKVLNEHDKLRIAITRTKHQNRCPHHWEYWICRCRSEDCKEYYNQPVPMPEAIAKEMVADWLASALAWDNALPKKEWKWFEKNFSYLKLHPRTWTLLRINLKRLGYSIPKGVSNEKISN